MTTFERVIFVISKLFQPVDATACIISYHNCNELEFSICVSEGLNFLLDFSFSAKSESVFNYANIKWSSVIKS